MIKNYLICNQCGKRFGLYESIIKFRLEHNKHFFCSRKCYLKFHSNQKIIKCYNCGKEFRIKGYRKAKHFYCSRECRKTSKIIKCFYCGKKFKRKPSLIKRNIINQFCSQKCMGKWQSKYKRGENSNTWLGGWEKYYGINWTEQKNLVRQRDSYACQLCGIRENGKAHDVHHKIAFREFGIGNYKEANKLENLVTLCPSCHNMIEPKKKLPIYCDIIVKRYENYTNKKAKLINGKT